MTTSAGLGLPRYSLQRWFLARLEEDRGDVRLHRGRIYILPTKQGYLFGVIVVLIVLGAMNYGASLGFAMAFLLIGLGLVSILHCFRNLHGLRVRIAPADPVFAGQLAHFPAHLNNASRRDRFMIGLRAADHESVVGVIAAGAQLSVDLPVASTRRGRLQLGAVRVYTHYPLALVSGWSWVKPAARALVYPAPALDVEPLPSSAAADGTGHSRTTDYEDFHGFRDYRPGDPLRHIAWRTLARGQPLQTKEFAGDSGGDLWLRWEDVRSAGTEQRLSQLCAWVLEAESRGLRYGLALPGATQPPGIGESHRRQCLELLALY